MGDEAQKQRISELKDVNRRLGGYEKEAPGLSVWDAFEIARERFLKYTLKDILMQLEIASELLESDEGGAINIEALSSSLICSMAIIARQNTDPTYPYLFLWGKYLNNAMRFSGLAVHEKNLLPTEYMDELKASKALAAKAGWSDFQSLRIVFDYFCNGGWYYFPDDEMFTKPIGSDDLSLYQLVTKQFLLSLPRSINHSDLYPALHEEIRELKDEIISEEQDEFKIGFEATDVFIYLTHIASEYGLNISELIVKEKMK